MNNQLLTAINKYVYNNNIFDNVIFIGQDKKDTYVVFNNNEDALHCISIIKKYFPVTATLMRLGNLNQFRIIFS
tara:strand:- start:1305 stop:1526 length:222 start_codon:yes stop_codon:yes gene_type:complete